MKRIWQTAPSIMLAIFLVNAATGANYYVSVTGLPGNDGLTSTSAWPTIQWALDRAVDDDIINVSTGVYAEWLPVSNKVTIIGQDIYYPDNSHMERHVSRTIIRPRVSPPPELESSLMELLKTNITLQNLTFDAEMNTNIAASLYSRKRPITVERCTFVNVIDGYGACVEADNANASDDAVSTRSHFYHNFFTNIINNEATGLYLEQAPANVAFNEFVTITGTNSYQGGLLINNCSLGTNPTTYWMTVDSNYFNKCTMGIWANFPDYDGHEIYIRENFITNCIVGIRVTAARGPVTISNNTIYVEGTSSTTNDTPARGIWVHADFNPWDTNGIAITDHQIINNLIEDTGFNTGTVGMLFEYDTTTYSGHNNGVRATVLGNQVASFDYGIYLLSGTNDVGETNHPLTDLDIHDNAIEDSRSYALYLDSVTNLIDAQTNWWGSYTPSNVIYGNADYSDTPMGNPYVDTDNDGTNNAADPDDDGDGLTDTNEIAIGTIPDAEDSDYDGQTDYEEYIVTGTDPMDQSSVFAASLPARSNESYTVFTWPSAVGRLYSVFRTTNIVSGFGSTPVASGIFPDVPMNTYTDLTATGTAPYFYRVVVTNTL